MLPLRGARSKPEISPRENTENWVHADASQPLAVATARTEAACHGLGHRAGHLMRPNYSRFQADKSFGSSTSWMLTYALAHSANVLFQEVPVLLIKGPRNEK